VFEGGHNKKSVSAAEPERRNIIRRMHVGPLCMSAAQRKRTHNAMSGAGSATIDLNQIIITSLNRPSSSRGNKSPGSFRLQRYNSLYCSLLRGRVFEGTDRLFDNQPLLPAAVMLHSNPACAACVVRLGQKREAFCVFRLVRLP